MGRRPGAPPNQTARGLDWTREGAPARPRGCCLAPHSPRASATQRGPGQSSEPGLTPEIGRCPKMVRNFISYFKFKSKEIDCHPPTRTGVLPLPYCRRKALVAPRRQTRVGRGRALGLRGSALGLRGSVPPTGRGRERGLRPRLRKGRKPL